jgi:RNA polymerase sigma factor (sigma-70 family)
VVLNPFDRRPGYSMRAMAHPVPRIDPEELLAHAGWVRKLARRLVGDSQSADDVLQQTLLTAMEHEPRPGVPLRPWLARIARNFSLRTIRSEERRARHESLALSRTTSPSPGDSVARAEMFDEVVQAVLALEPIYRDVVIARFFDGLAIAEVAARLGVPVETVRTRLRRALAMLRERLDRKYGTREKWASICLPLAASGMKASPVASGIARGVLMGMAAKWTIAAALALGAAGLWWMTREGSGGSATANMSATATEPTDGSAELSAAKRPKRAFGTAVVFGQVHRTNGSVPVAGQEVVLAPEKGDPWTVTTDARGAFSFAKVPAGEPHELSVAAKGCGTIRIGGISLARDERRDLGTLWLDPALRLTVRVRTNADRPVEGALVEAFALPDLPGASRLPSLAQLNSASVAAHRATTDAKGDAVLPEIAVGQWTLVASKDGFARAGATSLSLSAAAELEPVTIRLAGGHRLEGRVLASDGTPVPGALVVAGPPVGESAAKFSLLSRTTSDAEGRFAFIALEAGEVALWAGRAGRVALPLARVRVPLVERYDLVLRDTATLAGTVTDGDTREPVEGAVVRNIRSDFSVDGAFEGVTDAAGRYAIEVSEGLIGSVFVSKEGHYQVTDEREARFPVPIRPGDTMVRDLRLRKGGARIEGTVRAGGAVVPAARVAVHISPQPPDFRAKTATTDADGRFAVDGLPPCRAVLVVEKDGMIQRALRGDWWKAFENPDAAAELLVEVPEKGVVRRDLELVPGAVVEGRVEDEAGVPLAGARVEGRSSADASVRDVGPTAVSAPTGEDGAFRLEGVWPGPAVALAPTRAGYIGAANSPVAVADSKPTTGVVLRMEREPRVRGRIVAQSGAPLDDARVRIASFDTDSPWELNPWSRAASVPVSADGSYEAPVRARHHFLVRASAAGLADADSKPIAVVPGQRSYEVALVLDAGRVLSGRVVTKEGSGIAGAEISLAPRREDLPVALSDPEMQPAVWALTDASGSFRIPSLGPGRYDARATAPGFVAVQLAVDPADGRPPSFVLLRDLAIEGVVRFRDGRPAQGFQVAVPRRGQQTFGGYHVDDPPVITDAAGRFRLTGLAEGAYTVNVIPPTTAQDGSHGNVRRIVAEDVAAGSTGVQFVVEEGGVIAGRVVVGRGAPAAQVNLQARPPGHFGAGPDEVDFRDTHEAISRDDGTFTLDGLGGGPYDVLVYSSDPGLQQRVLHAVAVGRADLEILLEPGLSIAGRVVDAAGKPIVTALQAVPAAPGAASEARIGTVMADGTFVIPRLAPGAWRIEVAPWSSVGRGLVLSPNEPVQAGATELRLVAVTGASISGVVVDEAGRPVAGAWVRPDVVPGDGGLRRMKCKDDGTFEIPGLTASTSYEVVAGAAGRVTATVKDVKAGRADLRLVLAKGLPTSGRVVDAEGAPVRRAYVQLRHTKVDHRLEIRTDSEGLFSTGALAAGTYEASIAPPPADAKPPDFRPCGSIEAGASDVVLRLP